MGYFFLSLLIGLNVVAAEKACEGALVAAIEWVKTGLDARALEVGDVLAREVAGQPIMLTRSEDGQVRAYYNVCPHMGAKLVDSQTTKLKKSCVVCPVHRRTFDVTCGERVGGDKDVLHKLNGEETGLKGIPLRVDTSGDIFVQLNPQQPSTREASGQIKSLALPQGVFTGRYFAQELKTMRQQWLHIDHRNNFKLGERKQFNLLGEEVFVVRESENSFAGHYARSGKSVPVEVSLLQGGLVFLRFEPGPTTLQEAFLPSEELLQQVHLEKLIPFGQPIRYQFEHSFILWLINYLEDVHTLFVHKELSSLMRPEDMNVRVGGPTFHLFHERPPTGQYPRAFNYYKNWINFIANNPMVPPALRKRWAYIYEMYGSLGTSMVLTGELVSVAQVLPVAPGKSELIMSYYYNPKLSSADVDRQRELLVDIDKNTEGEDMGIRKSIQQGVSSNGYNRVVSPTRAESTLYDFIEYLYSLWPELQH